jgi:hypothetical protein
MSSVSNGNEARDAASETGEHCCPQCGRPLQGKAIDAGRRPTLGSDMSRVRGEQFWATTPFTLGVLALATALGLHELWAFLGSIFLGVLAVGFGALGLRRDRGSFALSGLVLGSIAVVFMLVVLGISVAVGDL